MSEFRVEKRREAVELTLVTGATLAGSLFLAGSSHRHSGPERVGDLLNAEGGFFPFEGADGHTSLVNRAHVLTVTLPALVIETELDSSYGVATRRTVTVLLTSGATMTGVVTVQRPPGRDRLSDYAHLDERFRYLELPDRAVLINSAHIVSLAEVVT
jgi:hypothetical protein